MTQDSNPEFNAKHKRGFGGKFGSGTGTKQEPVHPTTGQNRSEFIADAVKKAKSKGLSDESAKKVAEAVAHRAFGAASQESTPKADPKKPASKSIHVAPREPKDLSDDELEKAADDHSDRAAKAQDSGDHVGYAAHASALSRIERELEERSKPPAETPEPEAPKPEAPKAETPKPSKDVEQAKTEAFSAKRDYEDAANAEAFSFDPASPDGEASPEARAETNAAKAKYEKAAESYSNALGVKHAKGPSDVFASSGFSSVHRQNGLGFKEIGIVGKDEVPVRTVTPEEAKEIQKKDPDAIFHGSGIAGLKTLRRGGGNMADSVYFTPDIDTAAKYAKVGGGDLYVYDGPKLGESLDLDKPLDAKQSEKLKKGFSDHGYGYVDLSGTGHEALLRLNSAISTDGPRANQ